MSWLENLVVAAHIYGLYKEDKETEEEIKKIREERKKLQDKAISSETDTKKKKSY